LSQLDFNRLSGNIKVEGPKGAFKKPMLAKLITFLKEVKMEVKKINWPDRQKTTRYTIVVLGISLAVALYLGGLDFLFTLLLEKFVI
jgi:preprotein translocase subunit SecE